MSKQSKKYIFLFVLVMTVLSLTIACQLFSVVGEDVKVIDLSNREEYFTIESNTILGSISQGKLNVFTPLLMNSGITSFPISQVKWKQSDYLVVAGALHKFAWEESLEEWKLERMSFRLNCSDVSYGPQQAAIQFFRIIQTREKESRLLRDLWINPSENIVSWHEVEKYPNVWDEKTIILAEVKVPVEETLLIAENNGGSNARSMVEDRCVIHLLLSPRAEYSGWQVSYTGSDRHELFSIYVDPQTGEFEIANAVSK